MHISLNGERREVAECSTIEQLISKLAINPLHVAVEVNLQLIPRDRHATHVLVPGDQVEIVTFVGGG